MLFNKLDILPAMYRGHNTSNEILNYLLQKEERAKKKKKLEQEKKEDKKN